MRSTVAAPERSKGDAKSTPTAKREPAANAGALDSPVARAWAFGAKGGLRIQRKCACGGTCANCRAEEERERISRKADDDASPESAEPAPVPEAGSENASADAEPQGLIVEDDRTPSAGQMTRSAFVASLRGQLLPICDEELSVAGRTAKGCPYLTYWLDYASGLSGTRLERGIRRFTGTAAETPQELIDAVVSRVRAAVRIWVATGQVATPKALGSFDAAAGLASALGGIVGNLLGGDDEPGASAVQAKADGAARGTAPVSAHDPAAVRNQLGAGHSLDGAVRSRMEQGFGRSFAGVRIHTDSTASHLASGLSARAFTVGSNVAFKSGEYQPGSIAGDLLIAHELAHTVQQQGASGDSVLPMERDRLLEDDADRAAVAAVGSGLGLTEQLAPSGRTGLRLQGCQEVKLRCPKGYSWRVQTTAGWGSFGCTCFWKCLPGEPPGTRRSNVSEYRCPPDMNCSSGVRYETLGDDYEKKGYGAALTPLGEQAYCGCFPLNFEGEQVSDAPLEKTAFELTDIVGPLADKAAVRKGGKAQTDPTTGQRIPGKGPSTPKVEGKGGKPTGNTGAAGVGSLTTKPMIGRWKGEHIPGNPIWQGKTVKYLTDAERTQYKLSFKDGKIYDASGNLFDTSSGAALAAGRGNAIFVMDGLGNFFASKVQVAGEFHHSSLASGQPVAAAGEMKVVQGVLVSMTDRSGHYMPTPDMRAQAVKVLESNGISTSGKAKSWDDPSNP